MSITLEKITKNSEELYKMKLEAGKEGIKNIVQWVHIIEDHDVSEFLHGNELIFTTGITCNDEHSLINFVKRLYKNGVSGIVVNFGPYISQIPDEVLKFCNNNSLPIFSIPWEIKLVDLTRDFCRRIVNSEQVEDNIVTAFKDMIFDSKDYSRYISILERNSFRINGKYTIIAIYNKDKNQDASLDRGLRFHIEKITNRINDLVVLFTYKKYRIIVLCDYTNDNIDTLISNLKRQYFKSKNEGNFIVGVSSSELGLNLIGKSFKRAIETVELSIKKKENLMYYDDLGIYQLLLEAKDYTVLKEFYNKTIKPIESFDDENNSSYMKFIEIYLKNNGSVQAVADEMFVHRNTVNYQINKIKKITGLDLGELDVKLKFLLCIYIKDII